MDTNLLRVALYSTLMVGALYASGCGDSAPASTSTTIEKTTLVVPAAPAAKTDATVNPPPAPAPSAK